LGVDNDRFGEEIIAKFFHEPQGSGKEAVIEDFLIDRGDQGILLVETEDTTEHPVRKMEGMGKAHPVDPEAVLFHIPG
jgi:hypothetical protein